MSTTVHDILGHVETFLSDCNTNCPRRESEWLLGHVLSCTRSDLYLKPNQAVDKKIIDKLEGYLKRRQLGEPLQYIIGSTEFYNSEILVGPGVLIPRPETERLVELALQYYSSSGDILDLCTGSGAIVLALSKEVSDSCNLVGIDNSEDALWWAKRNANRLGQSSVQFLLGDLFEPVQGRVFEIITANPPYVSPTEYGRLPVSVKDYEPAAALLADHDGLAMITRIAESARDSLAEHGWLLCEIGETHGLRVHDIFVKTYWRNIQIVQDYNARDRFVIAQK